jgi:hypothetical protein
MSDWLIQAAMQKYQASIESRLREAVSRYMDLAVSEMELKDDHLVWEFKFLEPGTKPPPGKKWTIYTCGG